MTPLLRRHATTDFHIFFVVQNVLPQVNIFRQDLAREAERAGVVLNWNPKHPCRSVGALRLVMGAPAHRRAEVAQVTSCLLVCVLLHSFTLQRA